MIIQKVHSVRCVQTFDKYCTLTTVAALMPYVKRTIVKKENLFLHLTANAQRRLKCSTSRVTFCALWCSEMFHNDIHCKDELPGWFCPSCSLLALKTPQNPVRSRWVEVSRNTAFSKALILQHLYCKHAGFNSVNQTTTSETSYSSSSGITVTCRLSSRNAFHPRAELPHSVLLVKVS